DYAEFFTKFMDELDIKKATLIGHSYGGRVIIKLASREKLPFTIHKIVLVDM
ncbi:MAG: alpha/beta fold hydrolase, partial [Lachnospiraceae bacterium]|nr:alpha/beta fold hydrolase [Lachnospiraceae bacterium]